MGSPFPCCCQCQFCEDYYSPNQWYGILCEVADTTHVDYASRKSFIGTGTAIGQYFWESPSLCTEILAILTNWSFALTEPTIDTDDHKQYRVTIEISLTVNETLWVGWRSGIFGPDPAEEDMISFNLTFDTFELDIWVSDYCGDRKVAFGELRARLVTSGIEVCATGYVQENMILMRFGESGTSVECDTYPIKSGAGSLYDNLCLLRPGTTDDFQLFIPLDGSFAAQDLSHIQVSHSAGITCV